MNILPAFMSVPHLGAWCSQRPEQNIRSLGASSGCWDLDLGPQEKQLGS